MKCNLQNLKSFADPITELTNSHIAHKSKNTVFFVKSLLKVALPSSVKNNIQRLKKLYRERQLARQIELKVRSSREKLSVNYYYDLERFFKWSTIIAGNNLSALSTIDGVITQTNLKALITKDYHRIEKGLALREPKTAFGSSTVQNLIYGIKIYHALYGCDDLVQIVINTLISYYNFNFERGHNDKHLYENIINIKEKIAFEEATSSTQGGVIKVQREQILSNGAIDLKNFFFSRYSIRNFAFTEVEISFIEQAVEMAQKTPSVCNRQSSKVYVFSSDEDKRRVLSYQNGNRGFGEQANKVLIVTSDIQNFTSVGERNQCWIDGGMYAMSLIYALHSLGLGTCCLNWSVEYQVDQQLRQAAGISDSEFVIMIIAVGHMPDEFMVAQSPRKKVHEVLIVK